MSGILNAPHSVLSQKAKEVSLSKKDYLKSIVKEMSRALAAARDPVGVGLAAPQIGKSARIFIARPTQKSKIKVFINPRAVSISDSKEVPQFKNSSSIEKQKGKKANHKMLEGCLSLKNIWGEVERNKEITISYADEKGREHTQTFKGFLSIIVQHEMDHLDGVLFPKRVLEQGGKLYQSHKNEKGEDEFEELTV